MDVGRDRRFVENDDSVTDILRPVSVTVALSRILSAEKNS